MKNFDKNLILAQLCNDGFYEPHAIQLINELNENDITSINNFYDYLTNLKRYKNDELEFYSERGYSIKAAKNLLVEFKKRKRESVVTADELFTHDDLWFKSTVMIGLIKNQETDAIKKSIKTHLTELKIDVSSMITPIDSDTVFSQTHNMSWFSHDIFLKEHDLIIQVNSASLHPERNFEIEKAYYCIAKTNRRYLIIWENLHLTIPMIIEKIKSVITDKSLIFSSTDNTDVLNYLQYQKELKNQYEWDRTFLDVTKRLATHSKCQSKKVCAIAVRDKRIIATGLNGSVSGGLNCDEMFPEGITEHNREEHHAWSIKNEIHAEMSLLSEAAKTTGSLAGCDIYVSLQPCERCSLHLTGIGARRIVYDDLYDKGDRNFSLTVFKTVKIPFYRYSTGW